MERIIRIVESRSDQDIIKDWVELDKKEVGPAIAEVRGVYMDEIEKRFPDAFNAWMESDNWELNLTDFL